MKISGIIFIALFEAVGLLAAATKFRIEIVVEIGNRIFDAILKWFNKKHENP